MTATLDGMFLAPRRTADLLSAESARAWRCHGPQEGLGDIVGRTKDINVVLDQKKTSLQTAEASSRRNRDIEEQETGVDMVSKLAADRQLL